MGEEKPAVTGEEFLKALEKFGEKMGEIARATDRLAQSMTEGQDALAGFAEIAESFVEAHPELEEEGGLGIPYPDCAALPMCPDTDCHYFDPDFDPDSPENCTRKLEEDPPAPEGGEKG